MAAASSRPILPWYHLAGWEEAVSESGQDHRTFPLSLDVFAPAADLLDLRRGALGVGLDVLLVRLHQVEVIGGVEGGVVQVFVIHGWAWR